MRKYKISVVYRAYLLIVLPLIALNILVLTTLDLNRLIPMFILYNIVLGAALMFIMYRILGGIYRDEYTRAEGGDEDYMATILGFESRTQVFEEECDALREEIEKTEMQLRVLQGHISGSSHAVNRLIVENQCYQDNLNLLMELSAKRMAVIGEDGLIRYANRNYSYYVGERIAGKNIEELIFPRREEEDLLIRLREALAAHEDVTNKTVHHKSRNGKEYCRINIQHMRDDLFLLVCVPTKEFIDPEINRHTKNKEVEYLNMLNVSLATANSVDMLLKEAAKQVRSLMNMHDIAIMRKAPKTEDMVDLAGAASNVIRKGIATTAMVESAAGVLTGNISARAGASGIGVPESEWQIITGFGDFRLKTNEEKQKVIDIMRHYNGEKYKLLSELTVDEFGFGDPKSREELQFLNLYENDSRDRGNEEYVMLIKTHGGIGGDNKEILKLFASQVSMILSRTKDNESLERLFRNTVLIFVDIIETQDKYTEGHSIRVAYYSQQIAKQMGYGEEDLEEIEIAGLLHDIGKLAVRQDIIQKEGKLTDDEFAQIKRHPGAGYLIIKGTEFSKRIKEGVLLHHIRHDFKGYPQADEIPEVANYIELPEFAAIISLADAFDAITSKRSYKPSKPQSVALSIIKENSGTQFTPVVVDALLKICEEDGRDLVKEAEEIKQRIYEREEWDLSWHGSTKGSENAARQ